MSSRKRTDQTTLPFPHIRRRFISVTALEGTAGASCTVHWIEWVGTDPDDASAGSWVERTAETGTVYNGPSGRYEFDEDTYGVAEWWPDKQCFEVCDQDC